VIPGSADVFRRKLLISARAVTLAITTPSSMPEASSAGSPSNAAMVKLHTAAGRSALRLSLSAPISKPMPSAIQQALDQLNLGHTRVPMPGRRSGAVIKLIHESCDEAGLRCRARFGIDMGQLRPYCPWRNLTAEISVTLKPLMAKSATSASAPVRPTEQTAGGRITHCAFRRGDKRAIRACVQDHRTNLDSPGHHAGDQGQRGGQFNNKMNTKTE
jgi:hypothetical protein